MKKYLFALLLFVSFPVYAQQGTGKKVLFIGDSVTDGGWGNDVAGLPWDGIHPTPATHERMARLWIEKSGLDK